MLQEVSTELLPALVVVSISCTSSRLLFVTVVNNIGTVSTFVGSGFSFSNFWLCLLLHLRGVRVRNSSVLLQGVNCGLKLGNDFVSIVFSFDPNNLVIS